MSKLLGIVNPQVDPSDYFHFWLWRATEIPWEYEQLTIEKMDVESGNVQFRVIGPHTPRYPDGVFLKLQINRDLAPEIRITGQVEAPWIDPPLNVLLAPPNPHSVELAKANEPFSGQPIIPTEALIIAQQPSQKDKDLADIVQLAAGPPLIPADSMVNPQPSQKEQLVSQINSMLETLKALA
jgi:hypothetical protein